MTVRFFASAYATIESLQKSRPSAHALNIETHTRFIEVDTDKVTYQEAIDKLNKKYDNHPVLRGKECYFFCLLDGGSFVIADTIQWKEEEEAET